MNHADDSHTDDPLIRRLRAQHPAPPAADLAQRIVAHALRQPQRQPLSQRLHAALYRFFGEWHYALTFKAGLLAGFVLVGLVVGHLGRGPAAGELDPVALALGTTAAWELQP